MGGTSSFQLARVFGIRIGADASWFVILFLLIYLLSDSFNETLGGSDTTAFITAVVGVLIFETSIALHELGHALIARRNGIDIAGIDLWAFGGLAKLSRDSRTPGEEFRVAVAGPAVTLAIVVLFILVGFAVSGFGGFVDAATYDEGAGVSPIELLLSWTASINLLLLVFNLLPAFPLDGGRIAKAAVWRVTGDRRRATRSAARLGQGFAMLVIALGLLWAASGGVFNGLWLALLGMFMNGAARTELLRSAFSERLEGIRVADIMDREPVAIPADIPVARAQDEYFVRYGWDWFPVVDEAGRFLGVSRQHRVDELVDAGDGARPVGDTVDAPAAEDWRVAEDESLETVLGSEPLRRLGALMAVDAEGALRGVVTFEQVRRAIATPPVAS